VDRQRLIAGLVRELRRDGPSLPDPWDRVDWIINRFIERYQELPSPDEDEVIAVCTAIDEGRLPEQEAS